MAVPAWTADANESLRLSLVRAEKDTASLTSTEAYEGFHPTFMYPIFGDEEKIYGYNDLIIDLKFASGSLVPYLGTKYSSRLPPSSAVDDIEGTLSKFITSDYYKDETEFLKRVEEDAITFKPFGTMLSTYSRHLSQFHRKGKETAHNYSIERVHSPEDDETVDFEIYYCTWSNPGFREYHRRMQLFILLYIEAGSYINEEEDGWEFVVLYEKRKRRHQPEVSTYHFVGYSSLYPFYCFPEKHRMRLSQFVILPPYQQEGHGSALYTAIYQYVLSQPRLAELTVEDPAEAFEDLRDRNDLKMLLSNETFMKEGFGEDFISLGGGRVPSGGKTLKIHRSRVAPYDKNGHGHGHKVENGIANGNGNGTVVSSTSKKVGKMGPPADKKWLEKWRVDLKIASRQFNRLVEMLVLKHIDPADTQAMKAFRLQVKERLFRFNFEVLMQLDKKERQEKLEETFQSVREDYLRILNMIH